MSRYANKFVMSEVESFWDALAGHEYEEANRGMDRVHTQRFREAVRRLPVTEETRMLNIWSRVGDGVPFLRDAFGRFRLVNAELSLEMLRASRRLNPDEHHVQTSLHELPFLDSSFDVVMSLETLEHVPDPLLFLQEIRRVLVEGGILVMSLPPSAAEWTSVINNILKFHHGEGPHRFLAISLAIIMSQSSSTTSGVREAGTLFTRLSRLPAIASLPHSIPSHYCIFNLQWQVIWPIPGKSR